MSATTCTACQNLRNVLGQNVQCNPCRKSSPNAMTKGAFEATRLMRQGATVADAERRAFGR